MCKTRAKFIVVLDTSLFGAEARGIVAFRPQGTNPVASVCEREGPEWPFDSAQIWGWTAGGLNDKISRVTLLRAWCTVGPRGMSSSLNEPANADCRVWGFGRTFWRLPEAHPPALL